MTDPLSLPYSDNEVALVAERLRAEIADDPDRLDVASGYFAPSVWSALGDALDAIGRFRLLLGTDHELKALTPLQESANIEALVQAAIDQDTQPPGLVGPQEAAALAALIAFLERQRKANGEVVRLWRGEGFLHAKAYILDGSVGIGSANFTFNGLMRNRELVGWRQDRREVGEVRAWFERYWSHDDTVPYTEQLLEALRATPQVSETYRPFDVLIRTLAARYGSELPPSLEEARFTLKWFQEDAVFRLVRLLNGPARGALLADAVGLGKTWMAIGVIHHYLYRQAEARRGQGRPVLLIVPASLEPMWRGMLEREGLDWACRLMTMQSLRSDLDVRPHAGADMIVIDEAHRLRGGGTWFQKTMDLLSTGDRPDEKRVLLLTATPVNTGMDDLTRLLRVLAKNRRDVWAPEIADFERHLDRVEKGQADPFPLLDRSLVRRSRSDILAAEREALAAGLNVERLTLPERVPSHIDHGYDTAEEGLFETFASTLRRLALAPYDLDRYRDSAPTPSDEQLALVDPSGERLPDEALAIRPGSLAALYAAGLLTRFQSSIPAIRKSLHRLDGVLQRFEEAISQTPPRLLNLGGDPTVRRLVTDEAAGRDRDSDERADAEAPDGFSDDELDVAWAKAIADAPAVDDPDTLRVDDVRVAVAHDRELIAGLIARLPSEANDGKIAALIAALTRPGAQGRVGAPGLEGQRVLIFSQFRDTASYVHRRLTSPDVAAKSGVALLTHGGVSSEGRQKATAWFDPEREGVAMAAAAAGEEEPRILVSTDVLAEGHNLQLASVVINFDLHFNPQVAVQRAGRVDRIGSRHKKVALVSMLPPEDLDRHIGLLGRLDERFRRIHGLGLGDEKTMPLSADVQGQTLEQIRRLYRDDGSVLDDIERTWTFGSTDYMRQPLSSFLVGAGREQLSRIPAGVSSVKRLPRDWAHGPGVFLALAAPAAAGHDRESYWRFYPESGAAAPPLRDDVAIFRAIACRQDEPRAELPDPPDGPGIFEWNLIARAAADLAEELTLLRSQAEVARGASERSRKLRTEIRAGAEDLDVSGLDDLLDRLLQVRAEDFDARSGWSRFQEARRALKAAETEGERFDAATATVRAGLDLFGPPVEEDSTAIATEVAASDIQLVAYEALVEREPAPESPLTEQMAITELGQDQTTLLPDESRLR
ncbi:MAG: SNF2-related protein [Solirubrobacterales bacterium]